MSDPTEPMKALPLGAVVTRGRERGVVVWSNGRGTHGHCRMFDDDSYVIMRSPGLYTVGNAVGEWTVEPESASTARERVIGAAARWEPPGWLYPGDDMAENDSFVYSLMKALLPVEEREQVFSEEAAEWPIDHLDLALVVAGWLDGCSDDH